MSLQITTGVGSLIGVGIGAGDAATIVSLAARFGNWWTANSGDQAFLELLDEDEMNVLKRRGLLDLPAFNKRWNKTMRLLANGRPHQLDGSDAEAVLDQLGRFTAVMVSIVATLEAFTTWTVVKSIVKDVLRELLRTTEYGEDILAAQYQQRLNSWASAARIRPLSVEANRFRQSLIQRQLALSGSMAIGDSKHVVEFLVWLLGKESESWSTPSSDVAGIAACLAWLGVDILSVKGGGYDEVQTRCHVIYSEEVVLRHQEAALSASPDVRYPRTTVSLVHPEEAVTSFSISFEGHNQCRRAWKLGQSAGASIGIGVVLPERQDESFPQRAKPDITYAFADLGTECNRAGTEFQLAAEYAVATNDETVAALKSAMQDEREATLEWLLHLKGHLKQQLDGETDLGSGSRILAFSILQSFFLGYYYNIFLRIVDTKTLVLQTVEGAWRFKSIELLSSMRELLAQSRKSRKTEKRSSGTVSRQQMIKILSQLFLGELIEIEHIESTAMYSERWCLGVVQDRTLLANSLINPCQNPSDIGRFVLVDIDVGGIPRDASGLIRPSAADSLQGNFLDGGRDGDRVSKDILETPMTQDVSLHVEAAWDENPDALVLCARYKGRRIATISPARADYEFLDSWIAPWEDSVSTSGREKAIPYRLFEELSSRSETRVPISFDPQIPILI